MKQTIITVNTKHKEIELQTTLDGAIINNNRSAVIYVSFEAHNSEQTMINIGGPGEVTIESAERFLDALKTAISLAKMDFPIAKS